MPQEITQNRMAASYKCDKLPVLLYNQSTESTDGGEFETSVWQYPHQKEGNDFSWTCIVFYFLYFALSVVIIT